MGTHHSVSSPCATPPCVCLMGGLEDGEHVQGGCPNASTITPVADKMAVYTDPKLSAMCQERSQVGRTHTSSLGTPNLMGFSSSPRPGLEANDPMVKAMYAHAAALSKQHTNIITWEYQCLLCQSREAYFTDALSCQLGYAVSGPKGGACGVCILCDAADLPVCGQPPLSMLRTSLPKSATIDALVAHLYNSETPMSDCREAVLSTCRLLLAMLPACHTMCYPGESPMADNCCPMCGSVCM